MKKINFTSSPGATPIDTNELADLIPDYISTLEELNQLEQSHISDAFIWAYKQNLNDLLTASFHFRLHREMFKEVWRWAGSVRKSNKNIGVMKEHILNDLGQLFKNTKHWIDHKTFPIDEIAARFHHRLVQIHSFPNGNGRHARLMADLLLKKLGNPKFTWGFGGSNVDLEDESEIRSAYIQALRSADLGDFSLLLELVRK